MPNFVIFIVIVAFSLSSLCGSLSDLQKEHSLELYELATRGKLTDFSIIDGDGNKFSVHKLIFVGHKFLNNAINVYHEATDGKLHIKSSKDAVQAFILFLYLPKKFEEEITKYDGNIIAELSLIADYFQETDLSVLMLNRLHDLADSEHDLPSYLIPHLIRAKRQALLIAYLVNKINNKDHRYFLQAVVEYWKDPFMTRVIKKMKGGSENAEKFLTELRKFKDDHSLHKYFAIQKILSPHEDGINFASFFGEINEKIITASDDFSLGISDSNSGNMLQQFIGHDGFVLSASINPQKNHMVTASRDGSAIIWNLNSGNIVHQLKEHEGAITSANYNSDGTKIITASYDGTARVWDASTGETLFTLLGYNDTVSCADFSPDGLRIATSSWDNGVMLWDAINGTIISTFEPHAEFINFVTFSPDSQLIATASDDKTAKIISINGSAEDLTLSGHNAHVNSISFSPNGKLIVTASSDETAIVWDATTGEAICTLKGHRESVNFAKFSADSTKIITASDDGDVRIWSYID